MDPDKWFMPGSSIHTGSDDIRKGYTVLDWSRENAWKGAGAEMLLTGGPTMLTAYLMFEVNHAVSEAAHWFTGLFH